MKLLLGQNIADEKYEALKIRAAELQRPPALAVIMVGEDVASKLYITLKEKADDQTFLQKQWWHVARALVCAYNASCVKT